MQYNLFTTEEESCVRECVLSYFQDYEKIVVHANQFIDNDTHV